MQAIEFRAWDNTRKVMVYNVNINQGKPVIPGYQWFDKENTVYDSEPMQYINRQDKHDRKIFTGDIIQCSEGWLWIVEYDENLMAIRVRNQFGETAYLDDVIEVLEDCEIVGNKFEDTHLLEYFGGVRL